MVTRYGLEWADTFSDLDIEMYMIEHGGVIDGDGEGMFYHMMKARELLWPERYRHDWTDLIYKEIIEHDICCLMGSGSSQKTSHACEYALLKYWANPHNTLVILSTIDMGKLDTGVWAELKMLWKMGRERYPYLAGNMIDHKRSIATDNIDAGDVRDMRKGIVSKPCFVNGQWVGLGSKLIGTKQDNIVFIADECFPEGTLVDTPKGPIPIEQIVPGDLVLNALGTGRVKGTFNRNHSGKMIRIECEDGRTISCTENHEIFTTHGWVEASKISTSHKILGVHEAKRQSLQWGFLSDWLAEKSDDKPNYSTDLTDEDGSYVTEIESYDDTIKVFNLHVDGHHSYSVNGFLVANCQFMSPEFIGSWANLFTNPHVQIIPCGNPQGDPDDQLGIAAEPKEGWASIGEPTVTTCWDTKYMGGRCVNLVGTDSPNFRAVAAGKREPYPKLIGPKFAERTAQNFGIDSHQYYSQVRGIMKIGMISDRVITRQICRDHRAHETAVWAGTPRKKVHGLDPSYGGKDACISTIIEWGKDVDGIEIMRTVYRKEHRFNLNTNVSVEDQIADQVSSLLKDYGIPPEDSFYDPYGKGTLGFAFARKFGSNCPIPVDSGGLPTERPVRHDLFIVDKGLKRHKKCSEHYRKFVTEAWFSVRYIIEADQMREFPEDVMAEMSARKYEMVAGDKIEVEPKDKLKERTGKSPNLGDSFSICVEGARQRGFRIGRLGSDIDNEGDSGFQWLRDKRRDHDDMMAKQRLTYA